MKGRLFVIDGDINTFLGCKGVFIDSEGKEYSFYGFTVQGDKSGDYLSKPEIIIELNEIIK